MEPSRNREREILHELEHAGISLGDRFRFEHFGNTPELASHLGALVASGTKTATSSWQAVYAHHGLACPRVGDVEIICDYAGALLAVIEIVEVSVLPFEEVGEEHARLEGEGDQSLAHWRRVHRAYFRGDCEAMGTEFSERDSVLCQRFRLLYVPVVESWEG